MSGSNMKSQRAAFLPYESYTRVSWLKVGGVGMGVESMYASTVWAAIQAAKGRRIEIPDPPAGSLAACIDDGDLFRGEALRGAFLHWSQDGTRRQSFVENYPLPSYLIGPMLRKDGNLEQWRLAYMQRTQRALANRAGLAFHRLSEKSRARADDVSSVFWVNAFNIFKDAGDVNSLLLYAEDGYAARSVNGGSLPERQESVNEILSRPKMRGDLTECYAGILLMLPQSALWLADLAPFVVDGRDVTERGDGHKLYGMHRFSGFRYAGNYAADRQPADKFSPTPHVSEPWTPGQMAQYDAMPTLGWLHLPRVVRVVDESKAALPEAERVQRLQQALRQLVEEPLKGVAPVRVFYALADGADGALQKYELSQALAQALPGLGLDDHRAAYDIPALLGELGVGTSLVAVGLACVAAWEKGGNAFIIDWRDKAEATVIALVPESEKYRQSYKRRPYEMRDDQGGKA